MYGHLPRDQLPRLRDIPAALALLTRIPVPAGFHGPVSASSSWAWPIAGAAIGALGAFIALLLMLLGTSTSVAALLALGCMILATGALHEDGLADTADGLFGGRDQQDRLRIMKDSRLGAYGAIAIGLFLIGRHSGMEGVFDAGAVFGPLIAAAALSRAMMVLVFRVTPLARSDGLAASVGTPSTASVVLAFALAIALALAFVGWRILPATCVAAIAAFAVAWLANQKVGGITGDVLGASQQAAELSLLACFAAAW